MNTYSSLSIFTLALLFAGSVSAQSSQTLTSAAREDLFELKRHASTKRMATPAVERGGGPANDECDFATVLAVGTSCVSVGSTTAGATESLAPATCTGFTSTGATDVWFSFVATGTTTYIEATGGGDATTGVDLIIEAFSEPCGDFVSEGCVDATLRGEMEQLILVTVPGNTYYYRAYYWIYTVAQTVFDLTTCVYSTGGGPTPPNDECAGATTLVVGGSCVPVASNSSGATESEAPILCNGFTAESALDVWFTFTATATSTTIDALGITDFDVVMEVFSGSCGSLVSLGCADATFPPALDESFVAATTIGQTYTVRIYSYAPPTAVSTDFTICAYSVGGPVPPNDECGGAVIQDLAVGNTLSLSGDNTGATVDPPTAVTLVWEAFIITECADVVVNTCVPGSEFELNFINVAVNCPDFLTGLLTGTLSADSCTVTFIQLAAGTYYIPVRVDPALTPIGAYTIEVSATACGPVDPYCEASANSLAFEKIGNVTFSDINNTSTSTAGYEDFTGVTGEIVAGVDYNLSVTLTGAFPTDQVLAWIDFDQNQVFEDPAELVLTSTIGVGPHMGTVSIPLTATPGPTRMRLRLHDTYDLGVDYYNFPNPTPCDTSSYGQVEDYTVDVVGVITGVTSSHGTTFSLFPNPTNGDVNLTYDGTDAMTTIAVVDMTGRVVYSQVRQIANGQQVYLPLANKLAAGTYALRLTSEHGRGEQRFVVR